MNVETVARILCAGDEGAEGEQPHSSWQLKVRSGLSGNTKGVCTLTALAVASAERRVSRMSLISCIITLVFSVFLSVCVQHTVQPLAPPSVWQPCFPLRWALQQGTRRTAVTFGKAQAPGTQGTGCSPCKGRQARHCKGSMQACCQEGWWDGGQRILPQAGGPNSPA